MNAIALEPFVGHDPRFEGVLGGAPALVKVVDTDAHEALMSTSGEQVSRPRVTDVKSSASSSET